jgi:hypothetical protein
VRRLAEGSAAMSARDWREFWRLRGMRELRLVLWASWDPVRGAPPHAYDRHAFRIASLLGSRASRDALVAELGRIRGEHLGEEADPVRDEHAAEKVGDWLDHCVRRRDP